MNTTTQNRPLGVTVLVILASVLAVLSGLHALQGLGILPYFIGRFTIHAFSFWNFLMWGMIAWVYAWLIQMLWRVDRQAWLFLVVITVFNLILDFTVMLGAAAWSDVSISFLINALVLIYVMLPGTRDAFGQ